MAPSFNFKRKPQAVPVVDLADPSANARESFDSIYLDLSKESGKCRFAETGFGWKPSGGGDTFTLDHQNIGGAQWSRAAKGFEVKILLRSGGVVQLDGFAQDVSTLTMIKRQILIRSGLRAHRQGFQELV